MIKDTAQLREIDHMRPIVQYIKKNLEKGYKIPDLKWALISQGYSKIEVDKAIKMVTDHMEIDQRKKQEIEEARKKVEVSTKVEPIFEEKRSFWKRIFG